MSESTDQGPEGAGLVAPWLLQLGAIGWRVLATIALVVVLLRLAMILSTVTASILIAAIVAATFAPFVLALRDRGWSRLRAASVVFIGAGLVILATLAVIAIAFLPYVPEIVDQLSAAVMTLQSTLADYNVPPEMGTSVSQATGGVQDWLSGSLSQLIGTISSVITVSILATFLTFFFLLDGDRAWVSAMSAASDWRRDAITSSGSVALGRVGGYLRGTTVIAAFDGIVEGSALFLLGVPHAGALGVIVFLGRFIPYVGGLVTSVLLLLVTLDYAGSTAALILLVVIVVTNLIQGKVIAPVVYHKTVDIHPAVVLIALPAGAALAGVLGLFVAIPVVAFGLAFSGAIVSVLGVDPAAPAPEPQGIPIWLDRLGQWSWRLLVAIGLVAVFIGTVSLMPLVAFPVVLSVVLAATLAPVRARLVGRGWDGRRAAAGATFGAVIVVAPIVALALVSLQRSIAEVIDQATAGAGSADAALGGNAGSLVQFVQSHGAAILSAVSAVVSALSGFAIVLLLATLLTFYFLRDGAGLWQTVLEHVYATRRSQVASAGGRAFEVLGGYMIGTGAISLFGAVTQFLIMTILGIPLALPLAVLAFFGGFIPYIGSLVTTGLAFLVTIAYGTTADVVIMAVYTIALNIIQGNVVAPVVYSRTVKLHPAVILVAIPAGAEIAGVIGMFLAVPLLAVVATVWRTVIGLLDPGLAKDSNVALLDATAPE